MKFYIDTNTFPTNPALYADAEKSKRIPQILPVVQLTRGAVQIGFLGENTPPDGALVEFSATIAGTNTQVVLARGEKTANGDVWEFNLNFNSEALSAALEATHADVMLIAGIIVSTEAFRQEWQLRLSASETATGELDPKQVESAKDFADVAERAAMRAEEAARNSEQSALNASESAEAAQASAEAAKKSQEAAAQSAKEAAQSKTDAVSAKNAAEAAKTDAEKAKTDAEAAKTGAERARDDANEILRNVESEAESVGAAGEQAQKAKTAAESAKTAAEKAASDAQATLGNVYTKAESDAALATKADKSELKSKANDADVVKLTGNQTISGIKRFEDVIYTRGIHTKGVSFVYNIDHDTGGAVFAFEGANPEAQYVFPYVGEKVTIATLSDIPDISGKADKNKAELGMNANASGGSDSVALGSNSTASGGSSTALGSNSAASGNSSIALGYFSKASENSSTALGYFSVASGYYSTAVGANSFASKENEHVFGNGASGLPNSVAIVATNTVLQHRVRIVAQAENLDSNRRIIFQHEDLLNPGFNVGVSVPIAEFCAMIKNACPNAVDYTESSESGASS